MGKLFQFFSALLIIVCSLVAVGCATPSKLEREEIPEFSNGFEFGKKYRTESPLLIGKTVLLRPGGSSPSLKNFREFPTKYPKIQGIVLVGTDFVVDHNFRRKKVDGGGVGTIATIASGPFKGEKVSLGLVSNWEVSPQYGIYRAPDLELYRKRAD